MHRVVRRWWMMVDVIWFPFEPEHQNLLCLINLSVCLHLAYFHSHVEGEKKPEQTYVQHISHTIYYIFYLVIVERFGKKCTPWYQLLEITFIWYYFFFSNYVLCWNLIAVYLSVCSLTMFFLFVLWVALNSCTTHKS